MDTAVDTSVLLAILKRESGWEAWSERLRTALTEGRLLVCPIVFAEVYMGFGDPEVCQEALGSLGMQYSTFAARTAWLAGRSFAEYRRQGGPRSHLIPDFLIAAHSVVQAHRLAATDRGYFRRYFADLEILEP